jgi:hypothetical protein
MVAANVRFEKGKNMTLVENWDKKTKAIQDALNELIMTGDGLADRVEDLQLLPNTVPVTLSRDDLKLLRAMASTAGTTPQKLAARYLAGRITVEARQLMGGSQ